MYPKEFAYTKEHEWIAVDGELGTLGITDFAQQELGDIVYVELPEVGKKLEAGEVLGTVESVKAVAEIFAPVAGEVAEVNKELSDAPEKINEAPHEAGWICKLRLSDPGSVKALMSSSAYEEFIKK